MASSAWARRAARAREPIPDHQKRDDDGDEKDPADGGKGESLRSKCDSGEDDDRIRPKVGRRRQNNAQKGSRCSAPSSNGPVHHRADQVKSCEQAKARQRQQTKAKDMAERRGLPR
jgi:hypothetical protein